MKSIAINALKIFTVLTLFLASACKPEARAINYGEETCAYCRMTIVDKHYGTQLVSDKGKTYSFDAIECMAHFKHENPDLHWSAELVTDYSRPAKLIPAESASIIRTKQLPSPMGMYLTAVGSREEAEELHGQYGGEVYDYTTIVREIDNLPSL